MSKPSTLPLDATLNVNARPIKGRKLWIGRVHSDDTYTVVSVTTGGSITSAGATSITITGSPAKTIPKGEFVLFGTQVVQLTADCSSTTMAVKALRAAIPASTGGTYTPLMQVPNIQASSISTPVAQIGSQTFQDFSLPTVTPGTAVQNTVTFPGEYADLLPIWLAYRGNNAVKTDYDRLVVEESTGSGLFGRIIVGGVGSVDVDQTSLWQATFSVEPNFKFFDTAGATIDFSLVT